MFLDIPNNNLSGSDYEKERDQLARILENSLNEIYIFDANTLKFLYLNKGALKNMGFLIEEIQQLTPADIKPGYTSDQFRKLIEPMISGDLEVLSFETTHLRKDGSTYDVKVHLQKAEYHGKEALVAIIIDISEAKANQLLLEKMNKKLEERNEALDEFAHLAAHDLQEPVRLIHSFSDLISKKYEHLLDERGKKYLFHLGDASKRMQLLIQDLLVYSLVGKGEIKLEPVHLFKVLDKVKMDLIEKFSQLNGVLQLPDSSKCDPIIKGHFISIYRVFLNIINNALKFIPIDTYPFISVHFKEENTHWLIQISDNGIGMEKDVLKKIFKPFKRLHNKDEYEGSGLGLATCKKIILQHKGKIWAESMPGEGSTFYFTLPLK